jgi:hypothetical protein
VSDEPESRNESGSPAVSSRFLLWLALCLIAYPLSIGPVVKLCRGKTPPKPVQMFYIPLVVLSDRSPTFDRFLKWYVHDVWRTY